METPDELTFTGSPSSRRTSETGAAPSTPPEAERLKADISATQADLRQTVETIQERLSAEHLKEQAAAKVREATIGRAQDMINRVGDRVGDAASRTRETTATVADAVRENPVPYALIGIGVAWLLATRGSRGERSRYSSQFDRSGSSQFDRSGSSQFDRSGDNAERESTDRSGSGIAASARSTAADLSVRVRVAQSRVRSRWQTLLDENPIALGAAALAVGGLVGAAIPATHVENEYLGEARDTVVDTARSMAENTAQQLVGTENNAPGSRQGSESNAPGSWQGGENNAPGARQNQGVAQTT
jgi:hypothetical protein